MDYQIIPISQLNETELKRLSVLHHSVMHTLLSDLGMPIVLRYYQIARSDLSVIGLCAVNSSNEIVGWAMGSPHPDKLNSRLRTPFVWFLMQLFRLLFTHPLVLWQLVSSVVSSSTEMEMKRDSIELTYIGVASNHRSIGLGKDLLNAFIKECRENGYQSIVLSVETDNKPAIALYEKSDFKVIKTYSKGSYQRHRMELILG